MPVLRLSTPVTIDNASAASLAAALTQLTAERLGKRAEVTVVHIETKPPNAWFINGISVAQPTALLEIDITEGTNLAQEKADFIAAANALLRKHFGANTNYAEASYVVVREIAATDWGYGGLTQAKRRELHVRL
jgi:4-oxalocrotonate tautomerase